MSAMWLNRQQTNSTKLLIWGGGHLHQLIQSVILARSGINSKPIIHYYFVSAAVAIDSSHMTGFDLPRHTWSLDEPFPDSQGTRRANLHKLGLTQSSSCDFGQ